MEIERGPGRDPGRQAGRPEPEGVEVKTGPAPGSQGPEDKGKGPAQEPEGKEPDAEIIRCAPARISLNTNVMRFNVSLAPGG